MWSVCPPRAHLPVSPERVVLRGQRRRQPSRPPPTAAAAVSTWAALPSHFARSSLPALRAGNNRVSSRPNILGEPPRKLLGKPARRGEGHQSRARPLRLVCLGVVWNCQREWRGSPTIRGTRRTSQERPRAGVFGRPCCRNRSPGPASDPTRLIEVPLRRGRGGLGKLASRSQRDCWRRPSSQMTTEKRYLRRYDFDFNKRHFACACGANRRGRRRERGSPGRCLRAPRVYTPSFGYAVFRIRARTTFPGTAYRSAERSALSGTSSAGRPTSHLGARGSMSRALGMGDKGTCGQFLRRWKEKSSGRNCGFGRGSPRALLRSGRAHRSVLSSAALG